MEACMNNEQLASLGKKAFAIVTGINPEEVTFEEGVIVHKCKWERDGRAFEGTFHHWACHNDDSGTVCVTMEVSDEHTWHHLWGINSPQPFVN